VPKIRKIRQIRQIHRLGAGFWINGCHVSNVCDLEARTRCIVSLQNAGIVVTMSVSHPMRSLQFHGSGCEISDRCDCEAREGL